MTTTANNYNVVHMSKSPSLGEFEQLILLAILRLGDQAYGVSIRTELQDCAGRTASPGALYTTLDRMEQKGLLVPRDGEPTPERGGRAKRFYIVSSRGRDQLVRAQQSFHRLLSGLDLLGESNG